ncbi:MAG: tetratricopeptide repeat protein [Alphaproteobacteria bacterium]
MHILILVILVFIFSNNVHAETCGGIKTCLMLAEKGDLDAQLNVADAYYWGETLGVKKNQELGYQWYLKAAKQGSPYAQFNVAVSLDNGDGIEKDHLKAFTWYYLAAEKGHFHAQESVGDYYHFGEEIGTKNLIKAYAWYVLSLENGNESIKNIIQEVEQELEDTDQKQDAENILQHYREIYKKSGLIYPD